MGARERQKEKEKGMTGKKECVFARERKGKRAWEEGKGER